MASLVFVFIIVAVLFAFRARQAEKRAHEAEARAESQENKRKAATDAVAGAVAARTALLRALEEALRNQVPVKITDDTLQLPEQILFPTSSAVLKPDGKQALQLLGNALVRLLPCNVPSETNRGALCAGERRYPGGVDALLVEGHTDAQRYILRGVDGNWDLSANRAIAAFRELDSVPGLRDFKNLKSELLLGVAGYGSSRPTDPADTNPDRPADRRIEIRFLMAAPPVK